MPRQGIAPAPQRIAASTCSPHGRGRHRLQASFRRVPGSHLPETGLQAIQLSPYRADPPAHRPVRLGTVTGFLACYFPRSPFGSRVSHQIQRHLLHSRPATRAIQQCASWRTQVTGLLSGPGAGGWVVTPRMCTRRVWISITNKTCRRLRNTASTCKKSHARIADDWEARNCRHCDTRSHVVSELVEEVWLMPET
jgi:hypothetical protein